ncbi:hypothetical protein SDC9_46602 [bioreactor metagenome]|uniref:Uncharacterized protein n=1 Tax=bioreactor metagenome TaxID=1076179 RepID=A0A644WA32_9ZZZZ
MQLETRRIQADQAGWSREGCNTRMGTDGRGWMVRLAHPAEERIIMDNTLRLRKLHGPAPFEPGAEAESAVCLNLVPETGAREPAKGFMISAILKPHLHGLTFLPVA